MSDAVKWALAAALVVGVVVTCLTFPFVQYLPTAHSDLAYVLNAIGNHCGSAFYEVRGFINFFLFDFSQKMLSGLIIWFFTSWFAKWTIKITVWVYNFIFK